MTPDLRVAFVPLLLVLPLLAQDGPQKDPGTRLQARSSVLQVVEPDANDLDLRTTPVVRAVQRAADSVVSIYLQHQLARGNAVTEGQGSGVILDDQGLVITNWHVVAPVVLDERRGASLDVVVKLRDGRSRSAKVLSTSPRRDLALLQLRLEGDERVKPIEVGRSGGLMIGETVVAIGNPQGHANTVTSGVLSAIDRSIQVRAPDGQLREYAGLLQTDAAINQGNSGGALLDITGRLIGINNAMAMGAENIGFAIPIDAVRTEFEQELFRSDSLAATAGAPWLGAELAETDGRIAIASIVADGPAARAGMQVGDVVTEVDGQPVRSRLDYLRRFAAARPHRALPLTVQRAGATHQLAPELWSREQGTLLRGLGITVDEISQKEDDGLAMKATRAFYRGTNLRRVAVFGATLRLRRVERGGPADTVLMPDDLLLGAIVRGPFGDREVPLTSLRDLAQLVEQSRGGTVRLSILRADEDWLANLEVRGEAGR